MRIVLAEDEALLREGLGLLLERAGGNFLCPSVQKRWETVTV